MDSDVGKRVIHLKKLYDEGRIPTLTVHEVHPNLDKNDRINYIYFTLPVSLNFQRSSPAMWGSALKTFEDSETNYLFYPEKVVKKKREVIQKDLIKHKLALQKNKHTDIWISISKTLFEKYNSDPREVIKSGENSVAKIKNLLELNKKSFPYLNGLKMANYWLYILTKFTDINLNDIHKISIIPDTHVVQSSVKLGLVKENADRKVIEEVWEKLLYNLKINPVEMHPVLWNWSRNNFLPEV